MIRWRLIIRDYFLLALAKSPDTSYSFEELEWFVNEGMIDMRYVSYIIRLKLLVIDGECSREMSLSSAR